MALWGEEGYRGLPLDDADTEMMVGEANQTVTEEEAILVKS